MKYIGFELLWFDAWVGFFYDQKKRILYFCPLPCCVFKWQAVEHSVQSDECQCLAVQAKGTHEFLNGKECVYCGTRR